jgi:Heparinase II/III-like protein
VRVSRISRTWVRRRRGGGGERLSALSTTGHDHLPEIWCRCYGGPHESFKVAMQAHCAALSVKVCYGGVDIFVDPGTYCYLGDPPWWSYRRVHAQPTEVVDHGDVANWAAEHDGCLWVDSPARHRRSVLLDRASRIVDIVDQIDGGSHDICPVFHFGPEIEVELLGFFAFLSWPSSATPGTARLELPLGLSWSLQRAEIGTIPGSLGRHLPAFTLLGRGRCAAGAPLVTRLEFSDTKMLPNVPFYHAISWSAYGGCRGKDHETQAEAR